MKIKMVTLFGLLVFSSVVHAVVVDFSGTLDQFNAGPFSGGTDFTGSFTLDESVAPTGGSIKNFSGAVNNLIIIIDGYTLSGGNGKATQFNGTNGATDFFSIPVSDVSGTVGSNIFTKFSVDWRGPDLFDDPAVLANGLMTADFNYRRLTIGFNDSLNDSVIDNASYINFGSSAVPVPVSLWLFVSGLFGLAGVASKKRKLI